jgi:protoporphyrinogen IX oxidase
MLEFLNPAYLWIKAFHIIAVIAWMAGMLYLPRLYVYHCQTAPGSPESERFKIMERRLLRGIVNPSMIAAWFLGLTLALTPASGGFAQPWLHAKLLLVVILSGVHGLFSKWRKDFLYDRNKRPENFYRIWNEVPAVIMVFIVILVVVKPF